MKSLATTGLAAALLAALLSIALLDFSRQVGFLKSRLDVSESSLHSALQEIERLHRENRESTDRLEADLAARSLEIETRARSEALGVMRAITRDVEALYRDVLHPSVQVSGRGGVGGGTVLYSRGGRTYVLTAFHVVSRSPAKKQDAPDPFDAIEVRLYDDRGAAVDVIESDLVSFDEKKDLALLKLRSEKTFANVAHMASRETLRAIKVFTPVYAVGCPLGHDPLPTLGEVATLHKEVGGERFWMMNAPTIFGNSGGGIFHRDTRELIGISAMICTYDGVVSTPVPHLGILVSLETVYDWLDSLGHRFVYDPGCVPGSREEGSVAATPAGPPEARRSPVVQIEW